MNLWEITVVGAALAADAAAVTVSNCAVYRNCDRKLLFSQPLYFGLFQGLMTFLGFYIGSLIFSGIAYYAKYITAGVFLILGGKIAVEFFFGKDTEEQNRSGIKSPELTARLLTVQAVATSIDALVIGLTLGASDTDVFIASGVIAAVTFVLCLTGVALGRLISRKFGIYAQLFGGMILLCLAVKEIIGLFV